MRKPLLITLSLLSIPALAANTISANPNAIQTEVPTPEVAPPEKPVEAQSVIQQQLQQTAEDLQDVSLSDLEKSPELAEKALNFALVQRAWRAVEKILPIYQKHASADPILIAYAQGALLREQRQYKEAIEIYRRLIAENPDMHRVRLDLAILLYADQQDIAARDQFQKIRSEPNNDAETNALIDQYLERINQRGSWSFSGGVSYIQDDNVNNASKSKTVKLGSIQFTKEADSLPQKAHGFEFSAGANKDFNFSGSNYWSIDAGVNGKVYWDKHDYDDINLRLASGYTYKDASQNYALTPFVKLRYVGGDPYSKTFGTSLSGSYWLTPNWRVSSYNEIAWEKSTREGSKDKPSEKQLYGSVNVLFSPKSTQYFSFGANVFDVNNQSPSSSYTRTGASVTWNQDWPYGISTRLNLGIGQKNYDGKHYLGVVRKETDYSTGLTLWNRDWHLWGITPKLALRYNNVDSNIADLYSYDKGTVFVQFDKTF